MQEPISAKHRELMNTVMKSGAVDFEKLGAIVSEVMPQLFDPSVVMDNYIASGYSDIVKVWKMSIEDLGLEQVSRLKEIGQSGPN